MYDVSVIVIMALKICASILLLILHFLRKQRNYCGKGYK